MMQRAIGVSADGPDRLAFLMAFLTQGNSKAYLGVLISCAVMINSGMSWSGDFVPLLRNIIQQHAGKCIPSCPKRPETRQRLS